MRRSIGMVAALVAISGCSHDPGRVGAPLDRPGLTATAILHDAQGRAVGRAIASEVTGGLRLTVEASWLPTGPHGTHIHAVGRCDPPDFASAGGHLNPLAAHHGTLNAAGPHLGDLPNLVVAPGGHAALGVNIPGATMAELLDADGAALIIHAGADDMMSDPAGNSGGRIACGIFAG